MQQVGFFLLVSCFLIFSGFRNDCTIRSGKKHLAAAPAFPDTATKYKAIGDYPVPVGYERVALKEPAFGRYLRNFPLRMDQDTVYLYNGSPKRNQHVHAAILDLPIGKRDLQQCADVVMHLRAAYLYRQKAYDKIRFHLASGKIADYQKYAKGDYSEKKFQQYLVRVYSYANTRSLRKQMTPVNVQNMQVGDAFVQAGQPYGHAMIVVDMAINKTTGKKAFMLAQGFMPAQDAQLVINPQSAKNSPWYDLDFGNVLITPEWQFDATDLRRFSTD